jgi:hypothetical protein
MSVNFMVLDGTMKGLSLKYDAQSKPELRFTLAQETSHDTHGQPWVSYWPCCASGPTAERLAGELEDGLHVVITSGKLCYRKRVLKTGDQSQIEILVWQIDRLSDVDHAQTSPGDVADGESHATALPQEDASVSDVKKGKPRYPKWRPEQGAPSSGRN